MRGRALLVGLGVSAFINVWATYDEYVIHSSYLNLSHFPEAAFLCFSLVLIVNSALRRWSGREGLTRADLLTVLALVMAGSVVPTWGFIGFFIAILASPFYFANPENQWGAYFHEHVPSWIAPQNRGDVVRGFFEGLPPDAPIPWGAWAVPIFWWLLFLGAVTFVSACIVTILRRQWAHHEKLDYPLARVGIEMARQLEGPGILPGFMRGKAFWSGFAVAFGIVCWNMLSYFWPALPEVPVRGTYFTLVRGAPAINTNIQFYTVAFGFFASVQMLFSIWFFFLIFIVQATVFNRMGITVGEGHPWMAYDAATGWQSWGAFCVMVAWGMIVARHHLRDVLRKALDNAYPVEDGDELMSYRTAVFGLATGLVFILGWLCAAGMGLRMAALFTGATLIIYIGVSRIVAEVGLAYVRGPMLAQAFTLYTLGTETMSPANLVGMAFTYTIIARGTGLFMPVLTHVGKLTDAARVSRRVLSAVGVVLLAGFFVSLVHTLHMAYTQGAFNFNSWIYSGGMPKAFDDIVRDLRNPYSTDWSKLAFFGVGSVAMALMMLLRSRLAWWPIHPIGFTISPTYFAYRMGFSVFLAWAFKSVVMRVGGVPLFKKFQPFAVGLLVGWAMGIGLGFVVDMIWFPGGGHAISGD